MPSTLARPGWVNPPDLSDTTLELADAYDTYTKTVSPGNMAVALATASYLLHLCRATRASSVADFGSGFTSYVLAHYARTAAYPVDVISVDDDPEWLQRTAAFLDEYGRYTDLILWDDYCDQPRIHDVACYDLGKGAVREYGMIPVLDRTRKAVLYDDAQHEGHRRRMAMACRTRRCDLYFLQDETTDGYGRFAALAVRP